MKRLIALLLLIPLADIAILFGVAGLIGAVATVALVVLTALVGMLLVRAEGRHTIRRVERKLQEGGLPEDELIDGALIIASGAFFLTPGIVTDLAGLVLVLPPTRYPFRRLAKRYVITPYLDNKTGGFVTGNIYTSGFPNSSPTQKGSTYNLGEDEYSVNDQDKNKGTGEGSED